jgi:epoxide hydrolase-like predicted phosphatase
VALRALLLDYGGVLTNPLPDVIGSWCAADAVDPVAFAEVMRGWMGADAAAGNPVHALETGRLSAERFERELAALLGWSAAGDPPAEGLLRRMFAGMAPDPAMAEVVRQVRSRGVRTGLVSNSWGVDYARDGWDRLFDTVVISGEVGVRKPDRRIYRLAAERLGVAPEQCVFVDDLRPNVRGAVAVGMVGVHHLDRELTRLELDALFAPPPAGPAGADMAPFPKAPSGH